MNGNLKARLWPGSSQEQAVQLRAANQDAGGLLTERPAVLFPACKRQAKLKGRVEAQRTLQVSWMEFILNGEHLSVNVPFRRTPLCCSGPDAKLVHAIFTHRLRVSVLSVLSSAAAQAEKEAVEARKAMGSSQNHQCTESLSLE